MVKKILVVDDEPDILELLSEELQFEGFETLEASSGNDAIAILRTHSSIHAIVSDFKMPNGNGKVLLDFVNQEYSGDPIFYFVSGQAEISFQEALNEGVSKFFYKPFDLEELIKSLKVDLAV